jgi:hypothetical protein
LVEGRAQVAKCLVSLLATLSSSPSTAQKSKT